MIEQPPFTLKAAYKQRERWVFGAMQALAHIRQQPDWMRLSRKDRWHINVIIRLRVLTYALGFPVSLLALGSNVVVLLILAAEAVREGSIWCGQCRLEQHVNRRMILMRTTGRHGTADYGYFFCRGVQDHVCGAPYSSIDRVEDAIAEHYKTIRLSPAFVAAVRDHIEAALDDQVAAQQLLRKNLEDQLAQLATKEDNLLDLAADSSLPQERIRQRLREIACDRQRVTEQLSQVHGDLSSGRALLDAHLNLLENPYELYLHASEATRRKPNQAIFAHVYVAHDEVVGDDIRSPLRELLAAERGWEAPHSGRNARDSTQYGPGRDSAPHRPRNAKSRPEGRPGQTTESLA
ncbi:hypothetical protein [Timonella senegalensis]|uniref:hypothetical protein n=1 Tax=Timonella senegalensis TaxID=1465825 RepID=UPI0002E3DDCE|nr:hypothetical protein [Timonella senegalensis]